MKACSLMNTPPQTSTNKHRTGSTATEAWLVYDGDCPFCSTYVKYLRVRDSLGHLHLVNAREGGPIVDELVQAKIDLNQGMVLKLNDRYYHGADCINVLACLSTPSDFFNRINSTIFRSPTLARWLYPVLRAGRNTVLRLLGRTKIKVGRGA